MSIVNSKTRQVIVRTPWEIFNLIEHDSKLPKKAPKGKSKVINSIFSKHYKDRLAKKAAEK